MDNIETTVGKQTTINLAQAFCRIDKGRQRFQKKRVTHYHNTL